MSLISCAQMVGKPVMAPAPAAPPTSVVAVLDQVGAPGRRSLSPPSRRRRGRRRHHTSCCIVTLKPRSLDASNSLIFLTLDALQHAALGGELRLPAFDVGDVDRVRLGDEPRASSKATRIPRQGISPYEAMYIGKPTDTELHEGVTDYMTFLPQVYNADSIGYRPDLVGHEVTEWKELLDPKFKGKAAILDVPAIGIMDAAAHRRLSGTNAATGPSLLRPDDF